MRNLSLRGVYASCCVLLALSYGCSRPIEPDTELKINSVQQSGSPGTYNVAGITNLQNSSRITIAAVRYLRSPVRESSQQNITYTILARQSAEVNQGKWQTTLNLWQVSPDGTHQEAWQSISPPELALNPINKVNFIATFDAASQLQQKTVQPLPTLKGDLVRFTEDGEAYLQVSQSLDMELPSLKTTSIQVSQINHSRDSVSQPEQVNLSQPAEPVKAGATNSVISPSEILR